MRILFAGGGTGGHLYPALAIAHAVARLEPAARPFFIGARRGIEREVLPTAGFPFALLELHPLYRTRIWRNWQTVGGAFGAWRAIGLVVHEERPAMVVGTGGYASGLVLAWAAAHGLPQVQQVADSHPGLTARWTARWSRELYLGFPEAAAQFGTAAPRCLTTGNPIEPPPSPRPTRDVARIEWGFAPTGGRVLLIFGGSQGARPLNEVVGAWLAGGQRPADLYVIWATGRGDYERWRHHEREKVRVLPYLAPIAKAYAAADLALTRSGAMTTAELCAWGIPMVLVPLPTAAADHQARNARALEEAGAAVHVPQPTLTPARLSTILQDLFGDPTRLTALAARAQARGRPDAARDIARRILALLARDAEGGPQR